MQASSARLLVRLLRRLAPKENETSVSKSGTRNSSETDPAKFALLDPFMGSGAVLLEAMAEQCEAHGSDLSPLAVFVAQYVHRKQHTTRSLLRCIYTAVYVCAALNLSSIVLRSIHPHNCHAGIKHGGRRRIAKPSCARPFKNAEPEQRW
jgi:hypothetical protein